MKKFTLLLLLLPFFSFKKTNNPVDVFFGDSITFGNELYQLQYSDRWPKQYTLAVNTDEQNYAKSGASMITNAWSGRPWFDINEVPVYNSSLRYIFVSYWVNDYLYGKTSAEFGTATATAVDGIIAKGWPADKIVLCFNYLPESAGTWVDMTHAKALQWLGALRSVHQAKRTSFLDFYTLIYSRSDKASYTGDLIHPTVAWNAIMKDLAVASIEGPPSLLPATISSFSGQRRGNSNLLKWSVAQEQNVSRYEIQRSENGSVWTTAGSVNSLGATNSPRSYGFTDDNPIGSKQLYRLKIMDNNGAAKLSNIIVLNASKTMLMNISGLFPNPALSKLNVSIEAPAKETVIISVNDASGRILKTQRQLVETGSNTFEVNTASLPRGSYLIKVNGQDNVLLTEKFVKE